MITKNTQSHCETKGKSIKHNDLSCSYCDLNVPEERNDRTKISDRSAMCSVISPVEHPNSIAVFVTLSEIVREVYSDG